ncbi:MAG: hypothetical protein IT353_10805 [Gemmatimonadaceae bacterium]|nr:hypothetical protein [Gemmatimonadaceae bacterium]
MTAPRFRTALGARPRALQASAAIETATFVVVSIGGTRFALAVDAVDRVYRGDAPSALPFLPVHDALGRATRAPAMDAEAAFDGRALALTVDEAVAVAFVDAVHEVVSVPVTSIVPPTADFATPEGLALVRGQFTRHDEVVYLLDVRRVFRALYADALHQRTSAAGLETTSAR